MDVRLRSLPFAVLASIALPVFAADIVSGIVDPYLRVQAALASDSMSGVKADAALIAQGAATLGSAGAGIKASAEQLGAAKDIEGARAAFGSLSEVIIAYAESTKSSLGESTRQAYCPMVKKPWLQKGDTIANPYYGKKMPKCGEFRK